MCLYPISGQNCWSNEKRRFVFVPDIPGKSWLPHENGRLVIPCGKCVECRRRRKNEWTARALLESRNWEDSVMFTLTYNDVYNPGSLEPKHLQDFIKRVRATLYDRVITSYTKKGKPRYSRKYRPIKFIACGEYGEEHDRPHFHIIFFGYNPGDMYFWKLDDGIPVYRSPKLEKLWQLGFSSATKVCRRTLGYVVKYLQKYTTDEYIEKGLFPPFFRCSQGFGLSALTSSEIETIKRTDTIYLQGQRFRTPKYFLKKLGLDEVLEKRKEYTAERAETFSELKKAGSTRAWLLERSDRLGK